MVSPHLEIFFLHFGTWKLNLESNNKLLLSVALNFQHSEEWRTTLNKRDVSFGYKKPALWIFQHITSFFFRKKKEIFRIFRVVEIWRKR